MPKLAEGSWKEEFRSTFKTLGLPEDIVGRRVRFSCSYTTRCFILGGVAQNNGRDTFEGTVVGFRLLGRGHLLLHMYTVGTDEAEKVVELTYGIEPYYREMWCKTGFRWCGGRGTTDDPETNVMEYASRLEVLP